MDKLLHRAIAGVMWGGQEGRLPLFAWTLGLPQAELLEMIAQCFPLLQPLEPMTPAQYATVQANVPAEFHGMVTLLLAHAPRSAVEPPVRWLAHALAVACSGNQHLWEDLELDGRESVSRLLQHYFEPLYRRNTDNLRWKRFLYAELGAALGIADIRAPGCSQCDSFYSCFPSTSTHMTHEHEDR